MCALCWEAPFVQLHHIEVTVPPDDDIRNAIPLCPNCHDKVHAGYKSGRTTRQMTPAELRGHRAALIDYVAGTRPRISIPNHGQGVDERPSLTSFETNHDRIMDADNSRGDLGFVDSESPERRVTVDGRTMTVAQLVHRFLEDAEAAACLTGSPQSGLTSVGRYVADQAGKRGLAAATIDCKLLGATGSDLRLMRREVPRRSWDAELRSVDQRLVNDLATQWGVRVTRGTTLFELFRISTGQPRLLLVDNTTALDYETAHTLMRLLRSLWEHHTRRESQFHIWLSMSFSRFTDTRVRLFSSTRMFSAEAHLLWLDVVEVEALVERAGLRPVKELARLLHKQYGGQPFLTATAVHQILNFDDSNPLSLLDMVYEQAVLGRGPFRHHHQVLRSLVFDDDLMNEGATAEIQDSILRVLRRHGGSTPSRDVLDYLVGSGLVRQMSDWTRSPARTEPPLAMSCSLYEELLNRWAGDGHIKEMQPPARALNRPRHISPHH